MFLVIFVFINCNLMSDFMKVVVLLVLALIAWMFIGCLVLSIWLLFNHLEKSEVFYSFVEIVQFSQLIS